MAGKFIGTTYYGDDDDETVVGTGLNETILGRAGDDTLTGGGGDDRIEGGTGTDTIHGGDGNDTIDGGDVTSRAAEGDRLYGDAGDDTIRTIVTSTGLAGALIDGGADVDTARIALPYPAASDPITFTLTATGSTVRLGAVDALFVKNVERLIYDGSIGIGAATITGGALDDTIYSGTGDDTLTGGGGDDTLDAGTGKVTLVGGAGFDTGGFDLWNATENLTLIAGVTTSLGAYGSLSSIEAFGRVAGGSGSDTISVGNPRTVVLNSTPFDTAIDGGFGDDTLTGGRSDDKIFGGSGADTITGGDGDDVIDADQSSYPYMLHFDRRQGLPNEDESRSSNDIVHGGTGDDSLVGGYGRDALYGDAGNDTLYATNASLDDILDGGDGIDQLSFIYREDFDGTVEMNAGATATIAINGAARIKAVSIEAVFLSTYSTVKVTGGVGEDYVESASGNDTVSTLGGNDFVGVGLGSDTVDTGTGDNIADAITDGKDSILSGSGNDVLLIREAYSGYRTDGGVSLYDAGAGDDTIQYYEQYYDIGVRFNGTYLSKGGVVFGSIVGFEHFEFFGSDRGTTFDGTVVDDVLSMGGGNDTASGGAGNDTIQGGTGNDTLDGGEGTGDTLDESDRFITGAGFTIALNGSENTNVVLTYKDFGGNTITETDTIKNFENVIGSSGDDIITGDGQANVIKGGAGNDRLDGGAGGNDTLDYSDPFTDGPALTIVLKGAAESTVVRYDGSTVETDVIKNFENVIGGSGRDSITGDNGANIIDGRGGADTMIGGAGSDTYYIDNAGDRAVEADGVVGTDLVYASVSFSLAGSALENLTLTGTGAINGTGNALANVITGNAAANILNGGGGADTLRGGVGSDVYVIDNADDRVFEAKGGGADRVVTSVSYKLAVGQEIETLSTTVATSTAGLNLTGNEFANTITGNAGANVLNGGGGADVLQGLTGNDTYVVDNVGDRIVETKGGGGDRVVTNISYALAAGQEIETLATTVATGTAGLNLTGNEFTNTITGNAGANLLNGGAGADVLQGLGGNDTYVVDNAGDRIVEAKGGGADRVVTGVSYTLAAGQEIETLATTVATGTGAIDLTGNAFANTITGNAGANVLDGMAGNDRLTGLAGKDTFVFSTALGTGNVDHITDFLVVDDTIKLSKSIFTALSTGTTLAASAFKDLSVAGARVDADDRIVYDKTTGALSYDADGSGATAAVQIAVLDNKAAITHADFLIA